MCRKVVFCCFFVFGLAALAQQAATPAQSETARPQRETWTPPDERGGRYRTFLGGLTHDIRSCVPGKVEEGKKDQLDNLPCECLGIVARVHEKARQECETLIGDKSAWRKCQEEIPSCSEIVDTPIYQQFWGDRYRSRCQGYCKDNKCQCCDGGRRKPQADAMRHLMPRLASLSPAPAFFQGKPSAPCTARTGFGAREFILRPLSPAYVFAVVESMLVK